MQGPFEIDLKVRLRVGEENTATVTYSMPAGMYPDREKVDQAIAECLKSVQAQMDDGGIRLLDREEFANEIIAERMGVFADGTTFAMPAEWDE